MSGNKYWSTKSCCCFSDFVVVLLYLERNVILLELEQKETHNKLHYLWALFD